MKCSHCGFEMPEGAKFCGNCGSQLVVPELANTLPQRAIWFHADAPFRFILNNANGTYWNIPAGDSYTDLDDSRNWEIQFCENAFRFEDGQNLRAIEFENVPVECVRFCKTFAGCSNIHELNLKSFEVRGAVSVDSMFEGCTSLFRLDISGWEFQNLKSCKHMFDGCENLFEVVACGCDARTVDIISKALTMAGLQNQTVIYCL